MSKTIKEITIVSGKYTNAQGQEKSRYQRIGSMIETKNGPMLKIDSIPVLEGGWSGWAYLNDPKPKEFDKGIDSDVPFWFMGESGCWLLVLDKAHKETPDAASTPPIDIKPSCGMM